MQTMTAGSTSHSPTSYVNIVMKTDIESAFWKRQKITLVKLYREKFNKGLLDSKNAIETILPHSPLQTGESIADVEKRLYTQENLARMLELFFPSPRNQTENNLFFAITKMKENWEYLGYKSFKDGVLAIMANF
jgi:hypothetical protein